MERSVQHIAEQFGSLETRRAQTLVGIWGRTDNQKEMNGSGIFPSVWARFSSQNLAGAIPHAVESEPEAGKIYAAYFDIETDDRGPYSFFIGVEVFETGRVPDGVIVLDVPAGRFLKVSTEWGSFQTIGIDAWLRIWASEDLRAQRRFDVNLEVYGADAANQEHGRFDLYVGV